ncbi:MAG: pyrrolo-quinoline quinone [Acidobacteria bacterium]|nr:pyrrolo-quinoline quinone [Acidobacteriota bacterium]
MPRHFLRILLVAVALLAAVATLSAEDWPQWRGADRLGIWHETGIVEELPDELKVIWRTPIRSGYSGPAVADGKIFITDWGEEEGSRTLDGTERALALDEETGEVLWTHEWQTSYRMLSVSYAIGPRATPTVDVDRVYMLGATGRLFCLSVETGEVIWEKDYVAEYGTSVPVWGIVSAPLVDGDRLITVVGGEPDALVMAFDKYTGEEIWRAIEVTSEMGYAQPVIFEAGGVRQLIVWHPRALASLNPETGEVYWENEWEVSMGVTVATPVKSGDYLLVSQFFNGSLMMRFSQDRPAATELWRGQSRSELPDQTDTIHAMVTTPLIIDDHVYGVDSYGELRGLDARTGERLWMSPEMTTQARWSTAFMVQHGDRYLVNNDDGFLISAQFTPNGYVELDRTRLIEPTSGSGSRTPHGRIAERQVNWTHPAYANGHIVHRNDREIVRVSMRAVDY